MQITKAYQGFVEEPVPSALFDVIESGVVKRSITIAMLLAAFLSGIALVLLVNSFKTDKLAVELTHLPVESLAISSHNVLATDAVHPVQVYANDMIHLSDWLSYRMGRDLSIKMLTRAGFTLIGANQIPDGTGRSAMVVYENQERERLSLFTRYALGSINLTEPVKSRGSGTNAVRWEKNGQQHVLVSSLDHEILLNVYHQLQR